MSTLGRLYIVSAPSGGGKTSLTRALVPRLAAMGLPTQISVSYTTRAPRPGEQDGVHYYFVDEARFQGMMAAGDFLEHAEVFGRRYGTGRGRTEALLAQGVDVILDIDWQGGRQVRALAADAVSIFILPPSLQELEQRLRARGQDSEETVTRRMAAARAELSHAPEYEHWIINQSFERALIELEALFLAGRLSQARQRAQHKSLIDKLLAP